MVNEIVQGDSGVVLELIIQDGTQVVNLTGATVEVHIRLRANSVKKQATITDAINGKCEITLDSEDISQEGNYSFQATVTFSEDRQFSSNIERFPVSKKLGFIPSIGGNVNVGGSAINGNILINGLEIKVYDDIVVRNDINELKSSKHSHSNKSTLDKLTDNGTNLLFNGSPISGGTGEVGLDGKSAYELWIEQGNVGTVDTFLASLKGTKGDKGDTGNTGQNGTDGKSAYQIWLDAGNSGTQTDFLNSLKGEKGDSGTGGTLPSNVILFEDWVAGESVTIDTGTIPTDTTTPNNVTNLITSNVTATSLTLSWTVSSSLDVSGYDVYRGATLLTTVTGSTYNVTGLTEKTSYTFTVKAKDASNNIASGTSVTITTEDLTAPNNVTNLSTSNITATSVTLTWTASSSTDVSGYEVYNGSTYLTTVTGNSYNVSGLTANTNYTFNVKAKDDSNNVASGTSVSFTTSSVADTTAPNDVTNLTTSNLSTTSVTLNWTASSSSDIANYEIYNGGSLITSTASTSYTVTGLTHSTQYTLTVKAKDGAGNVSNGTNVTFTTVTPDTTAPDNVTNLSTANVTQTGLTLNWTASVSSDVASYDVYNGGALLGNVTGTTYNVTGLTASTQYTFYVKAKDGNNNIASGTSVTVTTSASTSWVTSGLINKWDNVTNTVTVTDDPIYFPPTGNFTVVTTIKSKAYANVINQFDGGGNAGIDSINLAQNAAGTSINGTLYGEDGTFPTINTTAILTDSTVYYHVVFMRDSTGFKWYVNNVVNNTLTKDSTWALKDATQSIKIGTASCDYKNVLYYSRSLTTEELTQNYNALK